MKTKLAFLALAGLVAPMFLAQTVTAVENAAPAPTPGTPSVLPPPDFHFPGNIGRTYRDSDPAQFPQPVQAPKGAPNVVLILIDDAGFGQFSTFGGGVPSPTMDKLAAEGLRYNRFHTTALCSPTRAALLTGRNHHSVASGVIQEAATGYDGYTGIIPRSAGTIAEVLRQNGYMTAWIGKNHNTPTWEASAAGPFDHWANGLGFDYFYGFNGGDMNHWNPVLFENRNLDHEGCACLQSLAMSTDGAGMHFNDGFTECETESQSFALRIGLFEGVEDFFYKLWFDADAIVADLDGDPSWTRIVRPHRNRAVFGNEFAGVVQNAPENLLQTRCIGDQLVSRCRQGN